MYRYSRSNILDLISHVCWKEKKKERKELYYILPRLIICRVRLLIEKTIHVLCRTVVEGSIHARMVSRTKHF
jgi:hypothetical protein